MSKTSGLFYANKIAYIFVTTLAETTGPATMQAIYKQADVPLHLYPPPNDLRKGFDFAYFSHLNHAFEKLYGKRGARGILRHAGRLCFEQGYAQFGDLLNYTAIAAKPLPPRIRAKVGLRAVAEVFDRFGDQKTSITDSDEYYIYSIHNCPNCWNRTDSTVPVCHVAHGLLEAATAWLLNISNAPFSGSELTTLVTEVACLAKGDDACTFHIAKPKSVPREDSS